MSLLTKIKSWFGSSDHTLEPVEKELEKLNKDDRLHQRYIIQADGIAGLRLADGSTGEIKDVSYGGIAVKFQGHVPPPDQLTDPTIATLSILDRVQTMRLKPVRSTPTTSSFIGFSVLHDKPETLIFLRDLIEPLRCGRSLVELSREMRHERFRGRDWQCLRGDGPTDVVIRSEEDGTVSEALLTFQLAGTYCDLSLKQGQLRTGRMLDQGSKPLYVGGQMGQDQTLDAIVLRHATFVLIGAPAAHRKLFQPLLQKIVTALSSASSKDGDSPARAG